MLEYINRWQDTNLSCRRIPNNLGRYTALRVLERGSGANFLLFEAWAVQNVFLRI